MVILLEIGPPVLHSAGWQRDLGAGSVAEHGAPALAAY